VRGCLRGANCTISIREVFITAAVEEAAAMRDAAAVVAAEAGIRSSMVSHKKKAKECQKVNKMSTFILLFPHSKRCFRKLCQRIIFMNCFYFDVKSSKREKIEKF
jgi:hypothetical protein